MFRSMRFWYFLSRGYRTLGTTGLGNESNLARVNTMVPRAMFSTRDKIKELFAFDDEDTVPRPEVISLRFNETGKYLDEVLTLDKSDLNWDDFLTHPELPKEEGINLHALIFTVCRQKKLHNCSKSFFNYLWERKEVTAGLLNIFCNTMLDAPENFRCCEPVIYKIFQNTLLRDRICAKICSQVLIQSTKYSETVYKSYVDNMANEKSHTGVITSLLKENKLAQAFDLYGQGEVKLFWLEKLIMEQLLNETIALKPTISLTHHFIKQSFKMKCDVIIPDENLEVMELLFKHLRGLDQNYVWLVNKGKLQRNNFCNFCKGKLQSTTVTKEEVETLVKDLEEQVVIQDNIFMKTSTEEWDSFRSFVNSHDYNIVLDALNLKWCMRDSINFRDLVDDMLSHNFNPLLLARAHFKHSQEYKYVRNKFPIFLTKNLSDDDVFVLYAAVKKGKDCYTLSNDKMRFCNSLLNSPQLQDIFKRWQATHQCKMVHKKICLPFNILHGWQESEGCVEDEFRYHYIATHHRGPPTLICISRIKREKNSFRNL